MDVGPRDLGLRRVRVAWKPGGLERGPASKVSGVSIHSADAQDREKLHRLGDDPVVASMALDDGTTLEVAVRHEHQSILAGPFV